RDAIRSGGRCNWLGDSMEFVDNDWRVVHRNFGGDLYAGTSGIGLFLARLHALEPEPTYRATAEAAMRHAATAARAMDPGTAFGLYTGLVGIAYALSEVALCLGQEEWACCSRELLEKVCAAA